MIEMSRSPQPYPGGGSLAGRDKTCDQGASSAREYDRVSTAFGCQDLVSILDERDTAA